MQAVKFQRVGAPWPPPWAYRSELLNGCILHRARLSAIPSIDKHGRRLPFELFRWDALGYESGLIATPIAFGISVPAGTLDPRWSGDVIDAINLAHGLVYNESG
jgi:hypothetical protein